MPSVLDTPIRIETDCRLAVLMTGFGGDQDHTVSGLATIDGGRGSILHDLHRLDIRRGQEVYILQYHSVHYIDRRGFGLHGTDTADTDLCSCSRLSRIGIYRHTGCFSLQGLVNGCQRSLLQILCLYGRYSTCQVALLHHAVTNRYHFLQLHIVRHQRHADRTGVRHFDLLALVPHERYLEHIACFGVDREVSVEIGNRTVGRTLHHHIGANHRIRLILSHHYTRHSHALRPYTEREHDHGGDCQYSFHTY